MTGYDQLVTNLIYLQPFGHKVDGLLQQSNIPLPLFTFTSPCHPCFPLCKPDSTLPMSPAGGAPSFFPSLQTQCRPVDFALYSITALPHRSVSLQALSISPMPLSLSLSLSLTVTSLANPSFSVRTTALNSYRYLFASIFIGMSFPLIDCFSC